MTPPPIDIPAALHEIEGLLRQAVQDTREPELRDMAMATVAAGGKRLRPRVMLLSFAAAGGTEVALPLLEAAAGMELIHAATLVHDDIIDQSDLRRGQPSVQGKHGADRAIIAGDFLFVKGFAFSAKQDGTVVALTAGACTRLAEGELLELSATARGLARTDLETYLQVIEGKTAAPIDACGRVGAHFAGRDDLQGAFGAFGRHLGMAFQITDDILDIRGRPGATGKPQGTDLRSGAANAVVLLGLRNGARAKLGKVLLGGGLQKLDVEGAIQVLTTSGAVQEAEAMARWHVEQAVAALDVVPDSPARAELFRLAEALPRREA